LILNLTKEYNHSPRFLVKRFQEFYLFEVFGFSHKRTHIYIEFIHKIEQLVINDIQEVLDNLCIVIVESIIMMLLHQNLSILSILFNTQCVRVIECLNVITLTENFELLFSHLICLAKLLQKFDHIFSIDVEYIFDKLRLQSITMFVDVFVKI